MLPPCVLTRHSALHYPAVTNVTNVQISRNMTETLIFYAIPIRKQHRAQHSGADRLEGEPRQDQQTDIFVTF